MHEDRELLPLVVDKLVFSVDGQRLLNQLSMTLDSRGITAIMGFNGAGKSLLLRLIHGLLTPDTGTIQWNGHSATDSRTRSRQSMVFQKPVLLRRSVAANIDYVLKLRARADRHQLRDEILATAGLLECARQAAHSLSGGEQQRLCLARALATEPTILLLDEPCANLDPGSIARIEAMLQRACTHCKIILVTHDVHQARRLAEDVVFVDRGQLAEHTPSERFFDKPVSAAALAYLSGSLNITSTG
jgi:tungstate transport system ATP-binding protein